MASVNKVTLLGNCGRDPEMKYASSGMAMCNISLATSSKRKDKNTGETIEETQWHRVQFYDKLAEIVGQYVKKGKSIYVEGRIKYGKYTDQAGVEKSTVDIVAESMQLLGGRDDDQGGRPQEQQRPRQEAPQGNQGYASQPPAQRQAPQRQEPQRQAPARSNSGGFEDMDDDIPFANPMRGAERCLAM